MGELDRLSFHGGCDLLQGEKWIVNYWIELPPAQWCRGGGAEGGCGDGGGGSLREMAVEYSNASGVRLLGKRSLGHGLGGGGGAVRAGWHDGL